MSVVTVTGENFTDFVLGKEIPETKPKAEVVDVEAKEVKEAPKEEPKEEEGEKKGRYGKLTERFHEVTQKRREAEERAEAYKKELEELKAKVTPPKQEFDPEIGPKPKAADYTDIEEYTKDLEEWKEKDTEKKLKVKAETEKRERAAERVKENWRKNAEEFEKQTPDYKEVIALAGDLTIDHDAARNALMKSEFGPQILYHLAQNPDLIEKLNEEDPVDAVRRIGRLESKFEKQAEKAEPKEDKPIRKPLPDPISPIKGTSVTDTKTDAEGNFQGSYAEFKALRMAGKL